MWCMDVWKYAYVGVYGRVWMCTGVWVYQFAWVYKGVWVRCMDVFMCVGGMSICGMGMYMHVCMCVVWVCGRVRVSGCLGVYFAGLYGCMSVWGIGYGGAYVRICVWVHGYTGVWAYW